MRLGSLSSPGQFSRYAKMAECGDRIFVSATANCSFK